MKGKEKEISVALPKGVKDFLPDSACTIKALESSMERIFELWGYRKVLTPMFEYLDVIAQSDQGLVERMFKFEDRASGRMLALRPDMTAQIARLAASHLKEHPKPLRLHYSGSVLRYGERDLGARREVFQSGLELIGLDLPEADGEVIALAIEAILASGLKGFKMSVGQVEFFRGVIEGLGLPAEMRRDVEAAVARKDRSGIESLLPSLNLNAKDEETLLSLTSLFGDRSVLDRAASITSNSRALGALQNLKEVLETVDLYGLGDYITIDLGEIRGLDYYTGVVFEGFVHGLGEAVCGGGRYDTLVGRYGFETPATGFALNLECLAKVAGGIQPSSPDFLLFNSKKEKHDALAVARYLRSKGYKVSRDIFKRSFDESRGYAEMEKIGRIIIVGGEAGDDNIAVHRISDGSCKNIKIKDLLEGRAEIAG